VRILPARIQVETLWRGESCGESDVPEWYERTGWVGWTLVQAGGKAERKAYAEDTEDAEFAEKSGEEKRDGNTPTGSG
jgi:hypothetical protein